MSISRHRSKILCSCVASLLLLLFTASCGSKGTTKDIINRFITKEGLKNITIALELYKAEHGEYPQTLSELLKRKGINDTSLIKDGWGRPYYYIRIDSNYELFSVGRDRKPFTKDDVCPSE